MAPLVPIACLLLSAGSTPTVVGPLTAAQVEHAVQGQRASTQKCARKARGASGIVVVGWQIAPDGAVTEPVVISTTLSRESVESCLQSAAGGWRFPATDAGVTVVSYPFVVGDAELTPSKDPLPRAVIDALIAGRHNEVTGCGERDSSGILELRWSVMPRGHISDLEIAQSELSRRVTSCVAERVSSWRFPPSRSHKSVEVSYCFVFQPYGSDEVAAEGLDPAAVESVVAASGSILTCYEKELAAQRIAAELEITWTIAPNGRVSSATVTQRSARHPRLERCLLATISAWRFPEFGGEPVTVAYPFYFAPM